MSMVLPRIYEPLNPGCKLRAHVSVIITSSYYYYYEYYYYYYIPLPTLLVYDGRCVSA